MAITRWDPLRDLMTIQNELNQLFGRTFGDVDEGRGVAWLPQTDVSETADGFVISMDLAGVAPEDVDISVEDSTLRVEGERKFYAEQPEESFVRIERRFGRFARSLTLPQTADTGNIEASFDAGVLTIRVPKKEEAQPRRITVKVRD